MSSDMDIDIEEHDLLEHPTLRGVFPDLSLVKQEVDYNDEEAVTELDDDILNDSWHEKPMPLPYDPDEPEEPSQQNDVDKTWPEKLVHQPDNQDNDTTRQNVVEETWPEKPTRQPDDHENEKNDTTRQNVVDEAWPEKPTRQPDDHDDEKSKDTAERNVVDETWPEIPTRRLDDHDDENSNDTLILEPEKFTEKPDSTTDLVVDSARLSPSDSPLVTSSQCVIPNPTTPEITDETDYQDDEEEDTFEDRCFESYVSLEDWGPYLDESKLYCAECEILFATENAIAAHNMADHSHLEEVSAPHYNEYQPKKYFYGSKRENSVHRCDKCPAKFTRFYSLKKHKVVIHGEMLGESKYPDRGFPQSNMINVRTVATVSNPKANSAPTENCKHLCQVCNTSLPSKEELIAHLYDHVTSQHKCEYCNALFSNKNQLEIHLLTHLNNRCSSSSSAIEGGISNSTSSTSVVNEHTSDSKLKLRERYGSNLPYILMCHICSTCFQNGRIYAVHMLKFHQIRVTTIPEKAKVSKLHCQWCKLTFEKIRHYNTHIKTKHILRECNLCMKKFKWSLIHIHKKKCPGQTIRTDSTSSTSAVSEPSTGSMNPRAIKVSPNTQTTHTATQDGYNKNLPYLLKCNICTKCFTQKLSYSAHMLRFHGTRVTCVPEQARVTELHCEPCNLKFSKVILYNAHILNVHHLRKCNLCKQKFKSNLIHVHNKKCPGQTIRTDSTSSTSAVTEPSSCSMSPQAIKISPNIQTTHTASQVGYNKKLPYLLKCNICTKCFTQKLSYSAHMLRFHGTRVTSVPEQARVTELHCEPCNLKFSKVILYNAHILNVHHLRKCKLCKQKYRWNLQKLHDKKCSGRASGTRSALSKNVLKVGTKLPRAARSAAVKLTDSHLKVHFVYKCIVCEKTFPTYKSAWRHKDKEHRGAWKVIVRDTQKLILKKSATEANTRKIGTKNSETVKLAERRIKRILNVILQCHKCNFHFPSWGAAIGHMKRVCRDGRSYTCKICRLKFYSKSTRSHMLQHRYEDKLTVVKLNEYEKNSHRILHNCLSCRVYMTARTSIVEHLSSHDIPDSQACTVCGYRIVGGQNVYAKHVNSHAEFDLSKSDYIIYRYAHTNETCEEAAVSSKEADSASAEEVEAPEPAEKSSELRKLIQCDTCKRHMTKKISQHYNKKCLSNSSRTCSKCGLAFTTQSIINHISEHRNSSKPLTFRDFDIISYSGKKVTMNVSDVVRSLNKCKCGIVSHNKYDLNTHKMKCGTAKCNVNEGVKCKICDVTYLKSSYTWHLMLHKRSTVPKHPKIQKHRSSENNTVPKHPKIQKHRSSENNTVPKHPKIQTHRSSENNTVPKHPKIQPNSSSENTPKYKPVRNMLSYVRCDKCHVHILNRMQGIRKHRAFPCLKAAKRADRSRRVCLKCGLIIPNKSRPMHENLHKSNQFAMKDLEILRMSNLKPVGKEICGFPHCNKCGLRFDSDTNKHKRYRCKSDDTPKTKCQTCGLTFTNDVYKVHLAYYGCDATSQAKKRKANEMDDSAEITKLISNYNRMDQAWSQLYQCTECDVLVDSYDEVIKHCEQHQSSSYEVASFVCHVCDLNFDYISFQRHKEQHFTRPGIERSCFEVLEFLPSKYKTSLWELYQKAFTGNRVAYKLKQEGPVQHTLYQCAKCKNICSDKTAAYVHTTDDSYCSASSKVCKECGLTIQCNSIVDHEKYHRTNPYLASSSFRIIWFIKDTAEVNEPRNEDETVTVSNLSKPILYKCAKCNIHYPSKMTATNHSHALKGKRIRISHTTCKKCGLSFTIRSLKKHHILHHVRTKYQRADFLIKIVRSGVSYNNQEAPQSQSDRRLLNVVPKNYTVRKDNVVVRKNQVVIRKNLQSEKRAMASGNIKNKLVLGIPAKRADDPSASGLPYSPVNKSSPTLYKCAHCDLHFLASTAAEIRTVIEHASHDHIGGIASEQKLCVTCNLTFWHESYAQHVYEHHQKAHYKEEDFDIFAVSSDKTFKVLRRRANPTIDVDIDSDRSVINLETVEIQQSKRHNTTKVPLYKCSLCNAHFLTETSMNKHFALQSHSAADNTECDVCRYHFKGRSILQHKYIHHKIRNLTTDDFQVVVRTTRKRDVLKPQRVLKAKRILSGVVYKCAACVVCFVSQRTMRNHGYNHKVREARDLKYCELCSMHFGKGSLQKHLYYHHPNGAVGNFKIVEVQPRKFNSAVNKNYNEMEIESADSKASVSAQFYENVEFLEDDNRDVTPPV